MISSVILILKGIAVGIANVIPGVSGGTIAFILGIYEQLAEAIGNFVQNSEKRKEYFYFLSKIGVGGIIGIVLFAKLMIFLLKSPVSSQYTYSFFLGLIAGSIPFVINLGDNMRASLKKSGLAIIAVLLVMSVSFLGGEKSSIENIGANSFDMQYLLWLAVCGFLAAGSMVLPGFSGSALLISLGEYANILSFVDNRQILPIAAVGIGAIPGVVVFAKVISIFLKKYPNETYYFILGLLIASIFIIIEMILLAPVFDLSSIVISLFFVLLGFVVAFFSSRKE